MPRTRLFVKLQAKVEERINSVSGTLLEGSAQDYPSYKDWVGYIRGLRDAVRLLDEIEGELDQ